MSSNVIVKTVKFLLYSSVLAILLVSTKTLFPLVVPKIVFYRVVIELALVAFLIFYLIALYKNDLGTVGELNRRLKSVIRNPLFIAVLVFFASALLSTIFAPNGYRAFFGNLERGEGFLGLLHYGVFLFLGLVVFEKKDWLRFAKILLVAVFVMMAWSWLQFSDFDSNSLANNLLSSIFGGDRLIRLTSIIGSSFQPGSFVGNPIFLAGSIIASLGAAAFLYFLSPPKSFFRYATPVFAVAAIVTIFATSVRGAILALGAGLIFLFLFTLYKGFAVRRFRPAALGFLILLVLLSFFWQKVPGLDRFRTVSFENPSVATRLIAAKVSWNAFLEKPIFGWGLENYNIAYNKHYDPRYALYAEDWFDRAHNKVAEVAVTQGTLGALAYLGIFAVLLRQIFKKLPLGLSLSLATLTVVYFVQNLFSFDSISSYIPFFAVIGMVIAWTAPPPVTVPVKGRLTITLFSFFVILASIYTLYAYNFLPWRQTTKFLENIAVPDTFLKPYTFAQGEIRNRFAGVLYNNGVTRDERFKPLVQESISALEEAVGKEPYEPRNFTLLAEIYGELAKDNPSFFQKSEEYVRRAIELSPNRQGLLFELAVTLAGKGENEEALRLSRQLVSENKDLAKAHYQLALVAGLVADSPENRGTPQQTQYREEAERELDAVRELAWGEPLDYPVIYYGPPPSATQAHLFSESDLNNMVALYRTWDKPEKAADVFKILIWQNFWFGNRNAGYYYEAINVYRVLRDKEGVVSTAKQLKLVQPSLTDDMDVIIDLAEKENWEILDTL